MNKTEAKFIIHNVMIENKSIEIIAKGEHNDIKNLIWILREGGYRVK